ncbi:MAG: hypothetical protein HOW73_02580 [Polyangiaceae bacterium]|nr:hypothetical protein [Polyangiaceae bacterium]
MTNLLPVLSLGFALGVTHAADADHVVAVSTMVGDRGPNAVPKGARARAFATAARIGTFWGAGHTSSVLLAGGAIIAFRLVVPPTLGMTLELLVSVMLVALGISSLRRARRAASEKTSTEGTSENRGLRSFGVGAMHGLAGSAAVALGILSQTPSALAGIGYLACFGVGTLVGMLLLTTVMALPLAVASHKIGRALHVAAGVASIGVGLVLFATIGHELLAHTLGWDSISSAPTR